ncbi:sensor histidine kinase [Nocardioides sp.]|uniref:sensor histidine kinase n=1 Tax=Nocardioides sp. TaxID=35761 RepID=UPI002CC23E4F|nr:ATP-binding protein [Nocardioides sp.]HXH80526.1 ATP-binding protein [Nocardioides sp.]
MRDSSSNREDERPEQGGAAGELKARPQRYGSVHNRAPAGEVVFMPGLDHAATLASLQESETRHRLVMLATNDIIWDADLVTETTLWSGAIEEILGYSDRFHHDDVWFRSSLHPDDFDRVIEALDSALGDPDQSLFEAEYRFRRQDGSYKDIFARGLILRDEHGAGVRMVGSMMDYTAQKLAETVLVEARVQAEAAQEAQTKFLANISHELRTPLTSILGLGELLLDGEMDPQQRAWAATMHRSAERLHAIINQFLDFSRTEAGFTVVDPQPFDLTLLLEQLEAEFAPLADQKDIRFTVEVSKDVDRILVGDALRIAQVLQNLLGNAIKFTKQGHVELRVERADIGPGPTLHFIVADSGVGFSAEIQRDLFQSFRQADESVTREYGGTGLGLAICKQLAELMGGAIHAESRVGEGSTFTFVLPVAP